MKKFLSTIITFFIMISLTTSAFATSGSIDLTSNIAGIEGYIMTKNSADDLQALLDDVFAKNPGQGEAWTVISLMHFYGNKETAGEKTLDFSAYKSALEEAVIKNPSSSASNRLFYALTLKLLGSESAYISSTLEEATGQLGIMSYVFALHLINAGVSSENVTADSVISAILSLKLSDGGYAISGDSADSDVTAMTLQALAAYYGKDEKVTGAIDEGLACLSNIQKDDGSYSSMGMDGPESSAQVVMFLSALGIDANTDTRFIKNGNTLFDVIESYKTSDGGYAHELEGETNATATRQALTAYVSYELMDDGENFYLFDSSKLLVEGENVPGDAEATTASEGTNSSASGASALTTKTILYIVIAGVAVLSCALMFLLKKRSPKTYIFIVILAGLACLAVTFLNFSSKEEYYGNTEAIDGKTIKTTISITCENIAGKGDPVPDDGIILGETTIELSEGDSAYDQIVKAAKANSIQLESEGTSVDGYVAGIAYIYEFDFGDLSGWMFKVNGEFADVGSSEYKLKDGDKVEWVYTTDLGKDVGDNSIEAK